MGSVAGRWFRTGIARQLEGYGWTWLWVCLATAGLYLARHYLDKGQASLLYLPVVIACAIRLGFGPALAGALLCFLCWDFFFLPPYYTFLIDDPKDWLSLIVFLIAAVTTAHLASRERLQTRQAKAREAEISTLLEASNAVSHEIRANEILASLTGQIRSICGSRYCLVFKRSTGGELSQIDAAASLAEPLSASQAEVVKRLAVAASENDQVVGFGASRRFWAKALTESIGSQDTISVNDIGAAVSLRAAGAPVGVLYVGPTATGQPFTAAQQRLILTLANHAAVVIAREALSEQASQAAALREADTLKSTLLSLVSHELRSPLAAIKASASGLLQSGSTWEQAEMGEALSAIDAEADRLSALVSNLLDLSRLEAGSWHPERDWCDVADIINTALDRLPQNQACRLRVQIVEPLPLIKVDYVQVALVLENLMQNAVKYSPAESAVIVSAWPAETPSGKHRHVTLQVRDYGDGIASDEAEMIFERFYRGKSHAAGSVHGTGLGLALCQAVVRAHGGTISASNAGHGEPKGAVFTVMLPVDERCGQGPKDAG